MNDNLDFEFNFDKNSNGNNNQTAKGQQFAKTDFEFDFNKNSNGNHNQLIKGQQFAKTDFEFASNENSNVNDRQQAEKQQFDRMKKTSQSNAIANDGQQFDKTPVAVNIPEDDAPFVILCGPPSSGKSMVLKSLASYLYASKELNYTIAANRTLLNTTKYRLDCDEFDEIIQNVNVPMKNNVDYLLADISDLHGNVVAHFLEAPGEDFFSLQHPEEEPHRQFKGYMDKIAQVSPNQDRKVIYIILLDLDSPTSLRNDPSLRNKYQDKMERLYNAYILHHPSRAVLMYNKVDIPQHGCWANAAGVTNANAIRTNAEAMYPRFFHNFQKNILGIKVENFSFLPYCTGSYKDGGYTASGPFYPASLWKEITKRLF